MKRFKCFLIRTVEIAEIVIFAIVVLIFALIAGLQMLLKRNFSRKKMSPAIERWQAPPNIRALCRSQFWTWDPYNFRIYPDPSCNPGSGVSEGQLIDSFKSWPEGQKFLSMMVLEINLHPPADSGADPWEECISNIDPVVALKIEQIVQAEIYFIQHNSPLRIYRPAAVEIEKRRFGYVTSD